MSDEMRFQNAQYIFNLEYDNAALRSEIERLKKQRDEMFKTNNADLEKRRVAERERDDLRKKLAGTNLSNQITTGTLERVIKDMCDECHRLRTLLRRVYDWEQEAVMLEVRLYADIKRELGLDTPEGRDIDAARRSA